MLEAEVAEGDFSDVVQAITNALRPQGSARPAVAQLRTISPQDEVADVLEESDAAEPAANEVPAVNSNRPPRKPYIKKVQVLDLDLKSGDMPLAEFVREKGPSSLNERYLVIAYWFKHYRQTNKISANHVYTAYKKVGWGTDIKDMSQPFRDLKKGGRGSLEGGEFVINHLGEDVVEKLGASK